MQNLLPGRIRDDRDDFAHSRWTKVFRIMRKEVSSSVGFVSGELSAQEILSDFLYRVFGPWVENFFRNLVGQYHLMYRVSRRSIIILIFIYYCKQGMCEEIN